MEKFEGFYKVATRGYSLTKATFYNPTTKEEFEMIVWDMDDDRPTEEQIYLNDLPLNEEVRVMWLHSKGKAFVGDRVKIVRGRKMVGEVKQIVKEFKYRPKGTDGFTDIEYWVFDDNTKCAKYNCEYYEG